jgi:hypothetical protein
MALDLADALQISAGNPLASAQGLGRLLAGIFDMSLAAWQAIIQHRADELHVKPAAALRGLLTALKYKMENPDEH